MSPLLTTIALHQDTPHPNPHNIDITLETTKPNQKTTGGSSRFYQKITPASMKITNLTPIISMNTRTHSIQCITKHRTARQISRTIPQSFKTDFKTFPTGLSPN